MTKKKPFKPGLVASQIPRTSRQYEATKVVIKTESGLGQYQPWCEPLESHAETPLERQRRLRKGSNKPKGKDKVADNIIEGWIL